MEQIPQVSANVLQLETPPGGCGGRVTHDNLAQARAVHVPEVREVQENPALTTMEKANHLLSESAGVVGDCEIAGEIDNRHAPDPTFAELHHAL